MVYQDPRNHTDKKSPDRQKIGSEPFDSFARIRLKKPSNRYALSSRISTFDLFQFRIKHAFFSRFPGSPRGPAAENDTRTVVTCKYKCTGWKHKREICHVRTLARWDRREEKRGLRTPSLSLNVIESLFYWQLSLSSINSSSDVILVALTVTSLRLVRAILDRVTNIIFFRRTSSF